MSIEETVPVIILVCDLARTGERGMIKGESKIRGKMKEKRGRINFKGKKRKESFLSPFPLIPSPCLERERERERESRACFCKNIF